MSPAGRMTRNPCSRMASKCAPLARNVTSFPAFARIRPQLAARTARADDSDISCRFAPFRFRKTRKDKRAGFAQVVRFPERVRRGYRFRALADFRLDDSKEHFRLFFS